MRAQRMHGNMHAPLRGLIQHPRTRQGCGVSNGVVEMFGREMQRGALVSAVYRMRDAVRVRGMEEEGGVGLGEHRAISDVPAKDAAPRNHELRFGCEFFVRAIVLRGGACDVECGDKRRAESLRCRERLVRKILKARAPCIRHTAAMNTSMPGLDAPGPDAALGDAARLFEPLIGEWTIETVLMPAGKPRAVYDGVWSFRWGLGGRSVYDVIAYRAAGSAGDAPYRAGITVRFYDTELRTWRQVWVGAWTGIVIEFAVHTEGSRIVIEGQHSATQRYRWSFEEISESHFWWEGRTSRDGGASWALEQTIEGRRV